MLFKLSSHEEKPPGVSVMWYLTINLAAVLSHIIGFLKRFSFRHAKNNIPYKYEGNLLPHFTAFYWHSTSYGKFTIKCFKSYPCTSPLLPCKIYIFYLLCAKGRSSLFAVGLVLKRFPFVSREHKGTSQLFNKTGPVCFLQGNHFC